MDVQMPEMDGFEATRIIRDPNSDVLDHTVPIVAMTANAMTGDREACLKAGMDDYISKPIDPQEFFRALERRFFVGLCEDQPNEKSVEIQSKTTENLSEPTIFDREEFLNRVGGNQTLFQELLDMFLKGMPIQLDGLKDALSNGDHHQAKLRAHSIKGMSANMGAHRIRNVALKAERQAGNGEMEALRQLVGELEHELAVFQSETE